MSGNDSGVTSGNQSTLDQNKVGQTISQNEADAASVFDAGSHSTSNFSTYPKTLDEGKQGKHIPGHSNYQEGKSELTISMFEASQLVDKYAGKGTPVGNNKERVDFRKIIGNYKDPITHDNVPTTIGIIHYSKSGTHIVPARPRRNKYGRN